MLPDAFYSIIVKVGFHEVTGTDSSVPVAQFLVCPVDNIGHPIHFWNIVRQPAKEQTFDRFFVGMKIDEVEPAAKGQVHQSNGPVCGVHRTDNVQVAR